jgi:hypothetical protein
MVGNDQRLDGRAGITVTGREGQIGGRLCVAPNSTILESEQY